MPEITIPLRSHDEAMLVLGPYDRLAKLLRQSLDIEIFAKRGNLKLKGPLQEIEAARTRIEHVLGKSRKGRDMDLEEIERILVGKAASVSEPVSSEPRSQTRSPRSTGNSAPFQPTHLRVRPVEPRNENQANYLEQIEAKPLVFGFGPAGTGKTFLAVAAAVRMLRQGLVRRLVITRPVVEAGEHLGFLPGDIQQKLNPYMRPVHDALFSLIEPEVFTRLEEAGVIEIAPLAYMRGRTLASSFVILDEAQNTSTAQMKMFLTRMGEGSHVCVTGDPSQSDLPRGRKGGLMDAITRLRSFDTVGVTEFTTEDVVRHPLVARIIRAYQVPAQGEQTDEATGGGL
ncbi:MAG: PhoH family protein [Planctomycetota bacterium]|nr:PhoH family protein [Planctomycetota bacterium]